MKKKYTDSFYLSMNEKERSNLSSAKTIVPYILQLFPATKSVLDVGCGTGTWLSVFKLEGVEDIIGLDGNWMKKENLLIPEDKFLIKNLEKAFDLGRKFDVVISLEVAEHIAEKYADIFIDNLVRHGDLIIFGAAIPTQGGDYHVNEQWQSYWRDKFLSRGYIAIDPIRGKFVNNPNVLYHYAQNILVYIRKECINQYDEIQKFLNIPFVVDVCLPYLILDDTPKSWKFILRFQKRLLGEIIKKVAKRGGYKKQYH